MAPKRDVRPEEPRFSLDVVSDIVRAANSAVLLPDLVKFNGEASSVEAKEWLRTVESQGTIARWNDEQKLETARRLLTNAGKSWYLLNIDEIKTWKDFRRLFYESFVGEKDAGIIDKWERFYTRNQRDKESAREYILEKLRLAKDVGATVRESKAAVCSGLKSIDMANYLKVFDYDKVSDWLSRIREFEAIKVPKSFSATPRPSFRSSDQPVSTDKKPTTETTSPLSTQGTSNGESKRLFCFNCKQRDHFARNCPQPKRPKFCSGCKVEGHTKRECTVTAVTTPENKDEWSSKEDAKPIVATIESTEAEPEGRKYLKTATVNGVQIANSVIDPGSRVCVMRAANAIKVNAKIQSTKTRIYGVGDLENGTEVLGCIVADIVIDNVSVPKTEILIVPDKVLPAPLLIGRTWTESSAVATIKWKDKFLITSADNQWFAELPSLSEDSAKNVVSFVRTEPVKLTQNDFNFGSEFSEVEREKCLELLNRYRKCFATNVFELGRAKVPPIDIEVRPGSVPIASKPYHTNAEDAAEMSRQIHEWKEAGIVVDTTSEYAAPAFLVGKKGGKKRPVFDYRKLNAQVPTVHYPLPNIDEILAALADALMYGAIDLACGYFQFSLTKRAQQLTAFVTSRESGQFTVLPFGYKNAPAEFAKRMEIVWRRLRFLFKYLDEAIFTAKTFEEFLQRLELVLQTLLEFGLTARPEKCHFGVTKIEFLGFEISGGEVRPGVEKSNAIAKFPTPKTVHQVRRFVGLTSFFRRFIEKFAVRISPLTELTKKGHPFRWTKTEQQAFEDIREALVKRPILRLYDPVAITEVHTDASKDGIAGMLIQRKSSNDPWNLVYAVSKKTTDAEAKYHSSKLELLAIVWSVTRLRQFLLGIRFTIVTDCQALLHLNANKTSNPQIARWALTLQEYDFVVHHRPGERMSHVDALSRAPVNEPMDTEESITAGVFQILTEEDVVRMYQANDPYIHEIAENDNRFCRINGIVYFVDPVTHNKLFVVPKKMRKALVIQHHDQMGHFSAEKVIAALQKNYWFAGMRRYVRVHVRNCIECLLAKNVSGKSQGLLFPIPTSKKPFENIHVDHLGPFVETSAGNNFVFVLVDSFTKYVCLFPTKGTSTDEVEQCLREVFLRFGLPERIISDQGTCFTSEQYVKFCEVRGIKPHRVAVRHPRANGQCERVNRILNAQLIIYASSSLEETEDWDRFLPEIQRNINASINRSTGRTPFELLHGYQPRMNETRLSSIVQRSDECEDLELVREIAQEHIVKAQEKMRQDFDRKHCPGDQLQIGEIVFMKCPVAGKLKPRFRGPMVVVQQTGRDIYRIQDLRREGSQLGLTDLHISQLRPWRPPMESDDEDGSEDEANSRMAECRE